MNCVFVKKIRRGFDGRGDVKTETRFVLLNFPLLNRLEIWLVFHISKIHN